MAQMDSSRLDRVVAEARAAVLAGPALRSAHGAKRLDWVGHGLNTLGRGD